MTRNSVSRHWGSRIFLLIPSIECSTRNLLNIGQEQLQGGDLNDMLKQVGIYDVGSFVNPFRSQVNEEATKGGRGGRCQPADLTSMGSSFLNQVRQMDPFENFWDKRFYSR